MFKAVDDKVERFEFSVICHVAEVDHLNLEFLDDLENVGLRKVLHRFLKELNQAVGIKFEFFLLHIDGAILKLGCKDTNIFVTNTFFFVSLQTQN